MIFNFLPSQLLKIASDLSLHEDSFSQWDYRHITIEVLEFFNQNPEIKWDSRCEHGYRYLPEQEKDYYLEYDGYWMLNSKDDNELKKLLVAWYQQEKSEKQQIV